MKAATSTDQDLLVSILSQSFEKNRSVNYVTKIGKDKHKSVKALMDYAFYESFLQKGAFLSENKQGVALLTFPNRRKVKSLRYILELFKLVINSFGVSGIKRILSRERFIKSFHPKQDFLYLWFIGILPHEQGKGNGSKLLQELIHLARRQNLPIYLETSSPENLPFYKKYGFEVYHEWFDKEAGFVLYFLKHTI